MTPKRQSEKELVAMAIAWGVVRVAGDDPGISPWQAWNAERQLQASYLKHAERFLHDVRKGR